MRNTHVLLIAIALMTSACVAPLPGPYTQPGNWTQQRLNSAVETSQLLNRAVREATGCTSASAQCGTYANANAGLQASPMGGGWSFDFQTGASRREGNYTPPPSGSSWNSYYYPYTGHHGYGYNHHGYGSAGLRAYYPMGRLAPYYPGAR